MKIKQDHRTVDFVIVTGWPTFARIGVSRIDSVLEKQNLCCCLFLLVDH